MDNKTILANIIIRGAQRIPISVQEATERYSKTSKEKYKQYLEDRSILPANSNTVSLAEAIYEATILEKQNLINKLNKMEKTEGQKRVRVDFNPNALKRVSEFKNLMSAAIDYINDLEKEIKEMPTRVEHGSYDIGDFLRETATAKTDLQKASMMGVAAITNDVVFAKGLHKKGDE